MLSIIKQNKDMQNRSDINSSMGSTFKDLRSSVGTVQTESMEFTLTEYENNYLPEIQYTTSSIRPGQAHFIPSPKQVLGVHSSLPVVNGYLTGNSESSAKEINESAIKSAQSMARHQDELQSQLRMLNFGSNKNLSIQNAELKVKLKAYDDLNQNHEKREKLERYQKLELQNERLKNENVQIQDELLKYQNMNEQYAKLKANYLNLEGQVKILRDKLQKSENKANFKD